MRRLLVALFAAGAVALAGCGDKVPGASSPLDDALGHLPRSSPFVVAISTDTDGEQFEALGAILDRFPFGAQVDESIQEQLEDAELDFDRDLKPLLGNDFVVGARDVAGVVAGRDFVGAIEVEDGGKLEELIQRDEDVKEAGESNGAQVYEDTEDDDFAAVRGATFVIADSRETLEQALEQREEDDRLRADAFEDALGDLPEDALLRVYGDLQAILEGDPDTREARKVKWVAALRTLGAAATVREDGISVEFAVRTEPGGLGAGDLPIAAGAASPAVVRGEGEVAAGIRDLSQIVEFGEDAARAVSPAGFSQFELAKRQIDKRLGIDVDRDLLGQFTGDTSITIDVADGKLAARAELEDPDRLEDALAKLADVLPDVAEDLGFGTVAISTPDPGEDFYALAQPDGDSLVFGVVRGALIVSNDPRRAGALASASPAPVEGAKGAVVATANAEQLADQLLASLAGGLAGIGATLFTGPLGDLSASLSASPEGLRGKVELEIE